MNSVSIDKHVLGIVCSVFDAYSAVLFLPGEAGDSHYLAASFSLGDNIPENVTIEPGKGLVGWILRARKPLIVSPFDYHQDCLGYYGDESEEQIKAFMGFPIPTGGALCVDSKRQYSFSEKDYKILNLFADLVAKQQGLGISAAGGDIPRYFAELGVLQDLHLQYKRWPVFLKNFLRTIKDATRFDYCAFATLLEDGDSYCVESEASPLLLTDGASPKFPLGAGIVSWVFSNGQPVYAEDGKLAPTSGLFGKVDNLPEFPSAICLPIFVNKSCRCVLCLANSQPVIIDESMRSFARLAADHLSMFLENLYLKNRLRNYLPKASIHRHGARVYNPDTAPTPPKQEDDIQE